jgi:hypothetical protein
VINQQTIIDKARLLLGIQFTARSYSDLDGVYSHERVIKSADFLISEISNRDKRIAEFENELSSTVAGLFSEKELEIRDLEQEQKVISRLNSYLIKRANEIGECLPMYLVDHIREFKGGAE